MSPAIGQSLVAVRSDPFLDEFLSILLSVERRDNSSDYLADDKASG
jgi:hypothetical protein